MDKQLCLFQLERIVMSDQNGRRQFLKPESLGFSAIKHLFKQQNLWLQMEQMTFYRVDDLEG